MARTAVQFDHTLGENRGLTDQFLRVWRVILSGVSMPGAGQFSQGSILSSEATTGYSARGYNDAWAHQYAAGLRIHFTVTQGERQTPNTAEITIYNLEENFAKDIIKENNYVILQAGYEYGNAGTIFAGTIKMYKRGHESATDSYLKIYAADGDRAVNEATLSTTFKENTEERKILDKMIEEYNKKGVTEGYVDDAALTRGRNIRPEVMHGMVSDLMRDFANQNAAIASILFEKLNWAKPDRYHPGAIVELNSRSGLIGFPEMTQDGINITALINSSIRLKQRVKLNNKYINQYYLPGRPDIGGTNNTPILYPTRDVRSAQYFADTSADGIYAPLYITYEGDSRGGPWYMHMICLAVDASKDNSRGPGLLGAIASLANKLTT